MIKTLLLSFLTIFALAGYAPEAYAAVKVGQTAPDFTGTDSNGNEVRLSDFKGKDVVLEWTNHECPFVIKHYSTGNMQTLQKEYTGKDVIWLSIVSSAEGKQGQTSAKEANAVMMEKGSKPTARILDPSGEIGKLYDARTTPHMFVINKEGVVAYAGAIDDNSSYKAKDVEGATNYVSEALDALAAGKPVKTASTKPYGCSVKY